MSCVVDYQRAKLAIEKLTEAFRGQRDPGKLAHIWVAALKERRVEPTDFDAAVDWFIAYHSGFFPDVAKVADKARECRSQRGTIDASVRFPADWDQVSACPVCRQPYRELTRLERLYYAGYPLDELTDLPRPDEIIDAAVVHDGERHRRSKQPLFGLWYDGPDSDRPQLGGREAA